MLLWSLRCPLPIGQASHTPVIPDNSSTDRPFPNPNNSTEHPSENQKNPNHAALVSEVICQQICNSNNISNSHQRNQTTFTQIIIHANKNSFPTAIISYQCDPKIFAQVIMSLSWSQKVLSHNVQCKTASKVVALESGLEAGMVTARWALAFSHAGMRPTP